MIANLRDTFKRAQLFSKLVKPTGIGFALRSAMYRRGPALADEIHLREAMGWLCRAEDATGGRGVSKLYQISDGWAPAYPETTGYILETFLRYAKYTGDRAFFDRAVRMGRWEIEIQHRSGGVIGDLARPEQLRTFNTGQVIHGWCSLYEATQDSVFLQAAVRASDYLLFVQELNGSWQKDSFCGARTYDARVAWALLRVAQATRDLKYARASLKCLGWVLEQQQPNGWWKNCGFFDRDPITHLLAYTLRGTLESYLLIQADAELAVGHKSEFVEQLRGSALLGADALSQSIRRSPALKIAGLPRHSYGQNWTSRDEYSCLTGNAQLAGVFFIIHKNFGLLGYRELGDQLLDTTKAMQELSSPIDGIRGGLPGPFPLHIGYDPYCYLNWATKFLADALLYRLNGFTLC